MVIFVKVRLIVIFRIVNKVVCSMIVFVKKLVGIFWIFKMLNIVVFCKVIIKIKILIMNVVIIIKK